jgi:hypothetical protein
MALVFSLGACGKISELASTEKSSETTSETTSKKKKESKTEKASEETTDASGQIYNEKCEELFNDYKIVIDDIYDSALQGRSFETFMTIEQAEQDKIDSMNYFDEDTSDYVSSFKSSLPDTGASDKAIEEYSTRMDNYVADLRKNLDAAIDQKIASMPQQQLKDKPELDFGNFANIYEHLANLAQGGSFHDFDNYKAIQVDEIEGVWTYLMINDYLNPSENSMAELGQAVFTIDVEHENGQLELYPYQMRNEDGSYSNIDPTEGSYLPFTGDAWINSRDDVNDTATLSLFGGTDDPGDSTFTGLYMFNDNEGHDFIIAMLMLPVGGVMYWMVFIR